MEYWRKAGENTGATLAGQLYGEMNTRERVQVSNVQKNQYGENCLIVFVGKNINGRGEAKIG